MNQTTAKRIEFACGASTFCWKGITMKHFLFGLLAVALVLSLTPSIAKAATSCAQQQAGELTSSLTWTTTDTITTHTFNVLRSMTAGSETVLLNIPFGTTYIDTVPAPTADTTYYYEIQDKGPGGLSPLSNEVCKTFFAVPPAPVLSIK
ncbi:MAG: hypothetical protein KGL39_18705 [Patescibacteria group bacterium]|nr:hypothetical protein [Patescibacteria group bacterium]